MPSAPSSVLVTGGAGFLGAYVVRAFAERGIPVHTADVQPPTPEIAHVLAPVGGLIEHHLCRVDDWAALKRLVKHTAPSHIVHAAAIVDPPMLATNPQLAYAVNVGGTVNVLQSARLFDVEQVVYLSSIGVLPRVQSEPIGVDHPIVLASEGPGAGFYGASKAASEAFCLAAVEGLDLDCRIVRPSAVYGLGMQWPIYIKPMVEAAVAGQALTFDHGGPFPRDYTHAEDVASLVVAVCTSSEDSDRVFYGATGRPLTTTAELAAIVTRLGPGADITVADRLSDDDMLERGYRGRLSIENAVAQLGWRPRFADIGQGVRHYIDQYRDYLRSSAESKARESS